MKYGKIRIEDGNLIFSKHMMLNYLPCKDILWAYKRREGADGGAQKQMIMNYLMIVTRRRKRYKFDMTEREVTDCIQLLQALNPEMAVGYPKGGRIPLQSLPNTRDLGALIAKDGRHILPRKLIRSGALYHVSMLDRDTLLDEYRIAAVVDFRSDAERKIKPDTVLPGVKYYHIPILEDDTLGISRNMDLLSMVTAFQGDPDELMRRQYVNFIKDQFSIKQYARFMDVVLRQNGGAVLWHCSMGKDRAGVGAALLLCALGIPRETIFEDYMKTNLYLDNELEYVIRYMESKMVVDNKVMETIRTLYKVKREYLEAVFESIEKTYGTVEHFLRKALYMTPKNIESLQDKYLI